ncbi:MAG TPA: hypothetical protein DIW81_27995 [Planctomycetaceae bacterium]|nr:hypothetical protein [Rubinisphaera sp.]HCS55382.1 hypothetical protein [Planctomycetaceae bacterium]|tara:strand:- start:3109 stop:4425 length:1317 start_codon:yes stop_codon:yes gene_type:complete
MDFPALLKLSHCALIMKSIRISDIAIFSLRLLILCVALVLNPLRAEEISFPLEPESQVSPDSMHGKVLCGYQGWFRSPEDGSNEGWHHWSRNRNRLTPESLTFEMWPEVSELPESSQFETPGFTDRSGKPARLFSSADAATVDLHFQWMQTYGIDGVFLQRFLVNIQRPSFDTVLQNIRTSARKSGRVYAICYDLSGTPADQIYEKLTTDWIRLVDKLKVTQDRQYQYHKEKPVVFLWGLYPDRFDAKIANRLIDFFHENTKYQATVVGGTPWYWRQEKDPEWAIAFRRLDILSPWNVGNVSYQDGKKEASTGYWQKDFEETSINNVEWMPVIYPGFSWKNLKGASGENATIPRRGGKFFWKQFIAAKKTGANMAYVAMFDEVDEATAIFKVTNHPPVEANFVTYEGLPADWYLRLTAKGTKVIRGEAKPQPEIPIEP